MNSCLKRDGMLVILVPARPGPAICLASMIQKIEVIMKKVRYVGFVIDNKRIYANISK